MLKFKQETELSQESVGMGYWNTCLNGLLTLGNNTSLVVQWPCNNSHKKIISPISLPRSHIWRRIFMFLAVLPCHQFPLEAELELFPFGSSSSPSFLYWFPQNGKKQKGIICQVLFLLQLYGLECSYLEFFCTTERDSTYIILRVSALASWRINFLSTIVYWWAEVAWLCSFILINWTPVLVHYPTTVGPALLIVIFCNKNRNKLRTKQLCRKNSPAMQNKSEHSSSGNRKCKWIYSEHS